MKFKGNKKLALTLITLSVIFSFFGGTLAYLSWRTSESQKTLVSVVLDNIGSLTIDGGNIEHMGMYPTADCDGEAALIGDIATATAYNATKADIEVILKLRASLSVTQNELTEEKKSKINWALVDTSTEETCETTPYRGTMASVTTNTDIDSGVSFIASADGTTIRTYRIYVWLDSTYTHTNYLDVVSDPMQELSISVTFSPASELVQSSDSVNRPNAPVLDNGMIPIKISADGVATTVSQTDSTWYNYSNKEWANVVLVKESGTQTRNYYKTNTGVTVAESDILAYYVWIPRYKYRIPQIRCSDLDSPTTETYPECYGAPYTMSDTDKALFIDWFHGSYGDALQSEFGITYTKDEAIEDVEILLSTGSVYIEGPNVILSFDVVWDVYISESSGITYSSTFYNDNIAMDGVAKSIDIVFESEAAEMSEGDAVDTYYTHPAFWWDDNSDGIVDENEKMPGIWVGKFETTGSSDIPTVLPNASSLKNQNISTQFTTSLKFAGGTLSNGNVTFAGNNTYGLISTTDSHMMKNSEWGVAVYLSHSQYGINGKLKNNYNSNYITGCGTSEDHDGSITSECQIAYGSGVTSYPQSTTGNITGIFDMSGGAMENVMGVYSDSLGNPMVGSGNGYSGFNGLTGEGSTMSSGIDFPESKYYNLYLSNQFTDTDVSLCTLETCGGHALYETAGWYGNSVYFVNSWGPFFVRGNIYYNESNGEFSANSYAEGSVSWRSVIVVTGA